MRFASYNIQYGTGKDGRVDLQRIAGEIGDADVIALQEVDRFWERSGHRDQPAELARLFPGHHWVYGAGLDLDAGLGDEDARISGRRRQFGNMLLARSPILSARNHLLPKLGLVEPLSLQRSALEGVIDTASGPIRVYSVHLAHAAAPERRRQIERLKAIIRSAPDAGGAWSGQRFDPAWAADAPQPPMPRAAVVMGDFNSTPEEEEYALVSGGEDEKYGRLTLVTDLVDGWIAAGNDPDGGATSLDEGAGRRIDYAFVTADLADKVLRMELDADATGSDHQPIWIDIEL